MFAETHYHKIARVDGLARAGRRSVPVVGPNGPLLITLWQEACVILTYPRPLSTMSL